MADFVKTELKDYIATVTLDRPPVNALTYEVLAELQHAFDSLNRRPDVRVAVLTGSGKCFCAGVDMKARSTSKAAATRLPWDYARMARESMNSLIDCQVPVIGALNGPTLGGGLGFAASCDILIASSTAYLGLPEINVGLLGGGRHAQRLVGVYKARKMMFTGERLGADELYRRGIIEAVVEPGALMDEALKLAAEIASKSPIAMRYAKHAMNTIEYMDLKNGYRFEQQMTYELGQTEDAKEAALAFLEKRAPVFQGH